MNNRDFQLYCRHYAGSREVLMEIVRLIGEQDRHIREAFDRRAMDNNTRSPYAPPPPFLDPTSGQNNRPNRRRQDSSESGPPRRRARGLDWGNSGASTLGQRFQWTPLNMNSFDWTSFMQPVPIRADDDTITRATTVLSFADIESPDYMACPIDHTQFEADTQVLRINHCGHIFNESALRTWFRTSVRCPLCRHDIRYNNGHSPIGTRSRSRSRSPRERHNAAGARDAAAAAGADQERSNETSSPITTEAGDGDNGPHQVNSTASNPPPASSNESNVGSESASPSPPPSNALDAFGQLLTQLMLQQSSLVPLPSQGQSVTLEQQFGIDPNSGSIFSFNQGPSVQLSDGSGNRYALDVVNEDVQSNNDESWEGDENDVD